MCAQTPRGAEGQVRSRQDESDSHANSKPFESANAKKYERYVHNYDFLRPLVQESEVLFKYINCYALFRRKIMDNAGFLPVTIWYFDGKNDVLGFAMTFGALDGRSRIAALAKSRVPWSTP